MVSGRLIIMEKTGDKLAKQNSQQSTDLYNYNLDHVYCSDNSRYRNAGTHLNITSAASDLKSLRKENKQLQAMLLLHLDLIQEQSNQLIAKDKQLIQLREENAQLRLKCERSTTGNERRPNNNRHSTININSNNTNVSGGGVSTATTITNCATTTIGHRMLNTSAGSPTIDSYFATTTTTPTSSSDPKVSTVRTHQQYENATSNTKFRTINTTNNFMFNNNNSSSGSNSSGQIIVNENQTGIHEMRNNSQTMFPIKLEVNSMPVDDPLTAKTHTNLLNNIGPVKERYKVVTSGSAVMSHDKTVKYRAIENNVIGHNNGKLISKIILQRKRSENGEKIFVRTKNFELGSNNRVNYGKWSPLRTIKSEVIDNDIIEKESELLALDTAPTTTTIITTTTTATTTPSSSSATTTIESPHSSTAALNDEEASSDVPNTDYVLIPTSISTPPIQQSMSEQSPLTLASSSQLPPSSSASSASSSSIRSTIVEQSDTSMSECHIESIKIEQDIDDLTDEPDPHYGSFDLSSDHRKLNDAHNDGPGISPSVYDDEDFDDDDDEDDEDDDDDPNTLNYSQDTSNIESPRASESMQCIPLSSSPVTSTISTSDYTHCDLFGGNNFDSNSSIQIGGGGVSGGCGGGGDGDGGVGASATILYPNAKRHMNRNAFLTTQKPYKIREWQLDEIEMELKQEITDEICKDENEANLELPKWRTWEMSSNRESPVPREYEDLNDDAFVRRHARFLLDERKRKKWDVQRIREQRTIERLKRRHCKDELNQPNDMNKMFTFYPTVDQLKTIQITDDLPVSAFGEPIPLLPPAEFSLPWHFNQNTSGSSSSSSSVGATVAAATTAATAGILQTTTTSTLTNAHNNDSILQNDQQTGVQLQVPLQPPPPIPPDYNSRPNSYCSGANLESAPPNVSSIIFLSKRRSGRTRTSISHNQPHLNVKCNT